MNEAPTPGLGKLLRLLDRLEADHIWYRLDRVRDALLVLVAVPGERWEIEFFEDGRVEVERFVSAGAIEDERALEALFEQHGSDPGKGPG